MPFKKIDPKMTFPKMEEEILKFWDESKIFEKSLSKEAPKGDYVFYDGPPFATGTPHYGHIVASTMKDIVPRYFTMKGFRVERKWGWDCHGLPIENIAEKELGIKQKTEIEKMGVDKFNEFCRSKVSGYVEDWKKVIRRLGRWADMKNPYKTMDLSFMESVWWVFKELWKNGLIYEGYRSMHICTRCETTLSQQEVSEGYKDIKDLSAIAKFELVDEPGTFVLAWTTTPWTLIGNVALAIKEDIDYIILEKAKGEKVIVGYNIEILHNIFGNPFNEMPDRHPDLVKLPQAFISDNGEEYKVVGLMSGKNLLGKKYKPLFDYYQNKGLQNEENGWKIYPADFVTTEEGTGVVHIAPAFGEDDLNLGKEHNLPFIQHVGMDGRIKAEATDFAGLSVKPQEDHQSTDVAVIKYLAKNNLLFAKEKYEHSYPHCWRCDTPLINYATSSWFVNVLKIKDKLLKNAEGINWSPEHIKEGRFGNWLSGARDWSISRQRYWASVMPIWKCDKCGDLKVVGSVDEIREQFGNPNKFFLVRHGQAGNNIDRILTSFESDAYHLTDRGRKEAKMAADYLKGEKIDLIFSSPFVRTLETAQIISEAINLSTAVEDRLREVEIGKLNGLSCDKLYEIYPDTSGLNPGRKDDYGIEGEYDIRDRAASFIEDLNAKYSGKNILIVSHGDVIRVLKGLIQGLEEKETMRVSMPKVGEVDVLYSKPVDLHKHIVDKITFKCEKCDGEMKRIPDVLDTWFDSGSMPYAQMHYPFENKEKFEANFPAEFIAEGVDQTRAWFYYLHVIAGGIKNSPAFKNVVVNGIVLAEDGKKMSKRLNNYPDPTEVMEKHGSDALRFYLASSPVMQAENLNFSEKDLSEYVRGMFRMLWNSYSFFTLYANIDGFDPKEHPPTGEAGKLEAKNLLDKWMVSELNILIKEVNKKMESYDLTGTARLFPKFIDHLSNWYIRRSRKRFWKSENDGDKNEAYATLHHVLVELSKLMAPFTPFVAEEIYKNLTGEESVHLADFPVADEKLIDEKLNEEMQAVRNVISEGLQLRAAAKIKVRQPLRELRITNAELRSEFVEIIKEELNVKGVVFDSEKTEIDTEITPELKLEGQAREVVRAIQEMRKEAGFEVDNRIKVGYSGGEEIFEKFGDLIAKEVLADELKAGSLTEADLEKEFRIDETVVIISVKR